MRLRCVIRNKYNEIVQYLRQFKFNDKFSREEVYVRTSAAIQTIKNKHRHIEMWSENVSFKKTTQHNEYMMKKIHFK